jgi:Ca2+-binding EF-hand superfamily protein
MSLFDKSEDKNKKIDYIQFVSATMNLDHLEDSMLKETFDHFKSDKNSTTLSFSDIKNALTEHNATISDE